MADKSAAAFHPFGSADDARRPWQGERFPPAPSGYVACRVYRRNESLTHLVQLDEEGSNGGRPTVCGLTRFPKYDENGQEIDGTADLPGWGMGDSGVRGPNVAQVICGRCFDLAGGLHG